MFEATLRSKEMKSWPALTWKDSFWWVYLRFLISHFLFPQVTETCTSFWQTSDYSRYWNKCCATHDYPRMMRVSFWEGAGYISTKSKFVGTHAHEFKFGFKLFALDRCASRVAMHLSFWIYAFLHFDTYTLHFPFTYAHATVFVFGYLVLIQYWTFHLCLDFKTANKWTTLKMISYPRLLSPIPTLPVLPQMFSQLIPCKLNF